MPSASRRTVDTQAAPAPGDVPGPPAAAARQAGQEQETVVPGNEQQEADHGDLEQQELAVSRLEEVGDRPDLDDGEQDPGHHDAGEGDPRHGREPADHAAVAARARRRVTPPASPSTVRCVGGRSDGGGPTSRLHRQHAGAASRRSKRSRPRRPAAAAASCVAGAPPGQGRQLAGAGCRAASAAEHDEQTHQAAGPHGGEDHMDHVGRDLSHRSGETEGVPEEDEGAAAESAGRRRRRTGGPWWCAARRSARRRPGR